MWKFQNNSLILFIITGCAIGANFPLARLATNAGISPITWAMYVAASVVLPLALVICIRGNTSAPTKQTIIYCIVAGSVSFFLVNLMLFFLIDKIGSGLSGVMFALSPAVTYVASSFYRLRLPGLIGVCGLLVALVGVGIIQFGQQISIQGLAWQWVLLGFAIPLALSFGNIYRTVAWPEDADALALALGSQLVSLSLFVILQSVVLGWTSVKQLLDVPLVCAVQLFGGAVTFLLFFQLQRIGGPVLLSQIGYVASAIAVIAGTVVLGETYGTIVWTGFAILSLGLICTAYDQLNSETRKCRQV